MNLFSVFSRRSSYNALSDLDDRRLSDLGLNRYDLREALQMNTANAGIFLATRRNERAESWLR